MTQALLTIADLLERRALDPGYADRPFLLFEDRSFTWRETRERSILYANAFLHLRRRADVPLHVGVLTENRPEFVFAFLGCALAGAVLVGLNTTYRGRTLARTIEHCDCQVLLTERKFVEELASVRSELPALDGDRLLVFASAVGDRLRLPRGFRSLDERLEELRAELGDAATRRPDVVVRPEDPWTIIFTSGSTGTPKAILNSHRKVMMAGAESAGPVPLSDRDVFYAAMPLFHSNSLGLALLPALVHGGKLAMARRFSARSFLADVRRYGVTVWNYVGKPFAYILATEERPDDADNPLRAAVGAGASARQQEEFARRFGVDQIAELFGSTEAGVSTVRFPGDPRGTVGAMPDHVKIVGADDVECAPAQVDATGALLNYAAAVGEIVNAAGPGLFEGYYANPRATAEKMRGGMFRTGDVGYCRILERGGVPTRFLYYVGRTDDWIRKDGENFVAEPIEEIFVRHPDVLLCSIYGVPCAEADEHVMAAIVLREGARFDGAGLYEFVASQPDLSPKWMPDYVRVAQALPMTETNKVRRPELRREGFDPRVVRDPIFWRGRGERAWKPFGEQEYARVREAFVRTGRAELLTRRGG
jgi:fatty-acyl-CoA synthase